jgi:SAM-dependent methyltransferase
VSVYDAIAGIYDPWSRSVTEDIEFYVEEALASGGPVVELACGTGRIAVPTAAAGVRVIGVDASAGMLEVARDFQRMGKIRVPGGTPLRAMRLHRVNEGAIEQRLVRRRVIAANPIDQFILTHHRRRSGTRNQFNRLCGFPKVNANPHAAQSPCASISRREALRARPISCGTSCG